MPNKNLGHLSQLIRNMYNESDQFYIHKTKKKYVKLKKTNKIVKFNFYTFSFLKYWVQFLAKIAAM